MLRKFLIIGAVWSGLSCFSLTAQSPQKNRISPEEFRARQKEFLIQKAELTPEEAAKFFPVYFELQDKKQAINSKAWEQAHQGKEKGTTDAEYEKIVEDVIQARIASSQLDLEYLKAFKKILSPAKIYKLQRAEMKFHRHLFKMMRPAQKK